MIERRESDSPGARGVALPHPPRRDRGESVAALGRGTRCRPRGGCSVAVVEPSDDTVVSACGDIARGFGRGSGRRPDWGHERQHQHESCATEQTPKDQDSTAARHSRAEPPDERCRMVAVGDLGDARCGLDGQRELGDLRERRASTPSTGRGVVSRRLVGVDRGAVMRLGSVAGRRRTAATGDRGRRGGVEERPFDLALARRERPVAARRGVISRAPSKIPDGRTDRTTSSIRSASASCPMRTSSVRSPGCV